MLPIPMIHKDYRVYRLPDGHLLECSMVDGKFAYAEVEFASVEEAKAFEMPAFLHKGRHRGSVLLNVRLLEAPADHRFV